MASRHPQICTYWVEQEINEAFLNDLKDRNLNSLLNLMLKNRNFDPLLAILLIETLKDKIKEESQSTIK